jgi:IcmF-related N-terminal domain
MLAYWPYILLALLLLVLATALFLYLVLRRARERAAPKSAALAPLKAEALEAAGFYSPLAALGLKSSFSRAMKTLRTHVTRRDYPYRLPWFLMVGESGSGKTTALGESGMNPPLGPPPEKTHGIRQGVNWFFFDRGVVLDVAGDMVLRQDGEASNQRGWNQLAGLLQRHRPERPLDGVVLTIPCTDLVAAARSLDGRARVEAKAAALYRKLWQAQKLLGMSFPVYVLVTKCDEVKGFQSLCRELPAGGREQMFGWSSPYTLETAYRPEWIEEAFQNVHRYLFQLQVEVFAERADVRDRDGLFLLPSEMQKLKGPLQLYLDQVFRESAFHDSFFFRGLYFCGDAGADAQGPPEETAALVAPPPWDGLRTDEQWLASSADPFAPPPVAAPAQLSGPRRPAFVKDLFEKKVFAEDMLARPLARTALSRNRTALTAQLLALAIPIVGLVGLLFTYDGLVRRSDEIYDMLKYEQLDLQRVMLRRREGASERLNGEYSYQPSSYATGTPGLGPQGQARAVPAVFDSGERGGGPATYTQAQSVAPVADDSSAEGVTRGVGVGAGDESRDDERHLFTAMSKAAGRSYYSFFIPTSWFSGIDRETRKSLVAGFRWVVFEDLAQGLRARTREFLSAEPIASYYDGDADGGAAPGAPASSSLYPFTPDAHGAGPLYDQTFRPGAPTTLRGLVEGFAELRVNRERYAALATQGTGSLDELKALASYLGHSWPQEDFNPNNELYVSALRQAHGDDLVPGSRAVNAQFAANVARQVNNLYERSFERRGVVRYDYLADISQTEALLTRPDYTWLATYVFEEPRKPFFRMSLSTGLGELRRSLEGLSRQSFMGGAAAGAPSQLHVRRHLVWDAALLRQALALCADYDRYSDERGDYSKSRQLDDAVRESARARLQANVAALLARATRYEPAPRVPGETARNANLGAEIDGLEQAQEPLSQLLDATARLDIDVGLRDALARQASDLLADINEEFREGRFYSLAQDNFYWWRGEGKVSLRAFGAESPDSLKSYLDTERKRIARLARELVRPVFAFASARGIRVALPPGAYPVNWDEISAQLDGYDNKQPGNSVSVLEEFINSGMDKASVDDCAALAAGDAGGARDFFILRRNELRRQLRGRCEYLARNKDDAKVMFDARADLNALDTYRSLADKFNRTLAGRFPFADMAGGVPLEEADPDAVRDFFADFDQKQEAARAALASNDLGSVGADAVNFLDRMRDVRAFFAQYIEKKNQPTPFVDFQLQFRSNREMESAGARQIIDWTLDVGRRKYGYRDQEMSGRWVVGEPIRLTLRWANNSPSVPNVAPDAATTLRARDRVATFEFKSRWSLLALMRNQAAAPGDFKYGVDALPYTLKFVVPTRPDGNLSDRQRAELVGPDAQVFMSVWLVAPGTKEPILLPTFPPWAPKF